MITGAHSIIYSTNADADRDFFRNVLQLTNVDVGDGWLIFGLPPAEVAVHPSEKDDIHEFYLMCDEVDAFVAEMEKKGVVCGAVQDMGWAGIKNGALLKLADGQFDALLTVDHGIEYQQNVSGLRISVVIMLAPSNDVDDLQPLLPAVEQVLTSLRPGEIMRVGG